MRRTRNAERGEIVAAQERFVGYLRFRAGTHKLQRMNLKEYVCLDPKVMLGKPTIRGTRITVELILRKLAEGATVADLTEAYPQITPEAIHAAMEYAADALAHEELILSQA